MKYCKYYKFPFQIRRVYYKVYLYLVLYAFMNNIVLEKKTIKLKKQFLAFYRQFSSTALNKTPCFITIFYILKF